MEVEGDARARTRAVKYGIREKEDSVESEIANGVLLLIVQHPKIALTKIGLLYPKLSVIFRS